jgi:hypothetical protein
MVADILFLHVSLHMVAEHFDLKYQEDLTGLEVKWIKHERFCAEEKKISDRFPKQEYNDLCCICSLALYVFHLSSKNTCVCSSRTTKVFDNVIFGNRACARNQQ